MTCKECGHVLPEEAVECPECGKKQEDTQPCENDNTIRLVVPTELPDEVPDNDDAPAEAGEANESCTPAESSEVPEADEIPEKAPPQAGSKKCKKCGHLLPKGTKICPECGKKQGSKVGLIIAIIAALLALLVIGGIVLLVLLVVLGGGAALLFFAPAKSSTPSFSENAVVTEAISQPEDGPYGSLFAEYADYILPNSNRQYLSAGDLTALSDEGLYIALQELYARQGTVFTDTDVQTYFDNRSWYSAGNGSYSPNEYETANEELLKLTISLGKGETISGNPLFNLLPLDPDGYILSDSDTRYLTASDLKDLSLEALIAARNEIYARRGYIFEDRQLRMYFYSKNWYLPEKGLNEISLSSIEQGNITLIQIYEMRANAVGFSADNPYARYYNANRQYIFHDSNTRELWDGDLFAIQPEEFILARNEIMARHGYTFSDQYLLEYFLQYDWYLPTTQPGDASTIRLSAVEEKNAQILKQQQDLFEKLPELSSLDRNFGHYVAGPGFSLQVPVYWRKYVDINTTSNSIRFCEIFSQDIAGGHLFTLSLYSDNSFMEAPSYNLIGYLDASNGNRQYLVAHYPTDVQFCNAAQALYTQMSNEIESILRTISANAGYTYFPDGNAGPA